MKLTKKISIWLMCLSLVFGESSMNVLAFEIPGGHPTAVVSDSNENSGDGSEGSDGSGDDSEGNGDSGDDSEGNGDSGDSSDDGADEDGSSDDNGSGSDDGADGEDGSGDSGDSSEDGSDDGENSEAGDNGDTDSEDETSTDDSDGTDDTDSEDGLNSDPDEEALEDADADIDEDLESLTADANTEEADTQTTYNITYVLYDGINNPANPSEYTAGSAAIVFKKPSKTGFSFKGWYTDSSFKKEITQIKKGSTGDITIYAKWTANKYTVTFHENGGSGTTKSMTCSYGSSYKLRTCKFKRKGYKFIGWAVSKKGSVVYSDKAPIENLSSKNGGNINLYAKWQTVPYTYTYHLNAGSDPSATLGAGVSASGTYTVKNKVSFVKPSRAGYTFMGWYTDSKCRHKLSSIKKGTTGNKKLYAKWQGKKYYVVFKANGGTGSMKTITGTYSYGKKKLPKCKMTKKGNVFMGWSTSPNGSVVYADGADLSGLAKSSKAKKVTLYAVWGELSPETDYGVFLGIDSTDTDRLAEISGYDLVIIDADVLTAADIAGLHARNGAVYSYIDVGSLETYRSYYDDFEDLILAPYEHWDDEYWIDVSAVSWQTHLAELEDTYLAKGVDGFFADNADIYYISQSENVGDPTAIYNGLVTIFTTMKSKGPVLINGADTFVSAYIEDVGNLSDVCTGVNQETVFSSINWDAGTFGTASAEDTEYYTEYLADVAAAGGAVYLLEYTKDKDLAIKIDTYCRQKNYYYYISDSLDLD